MLFIVANSGMADGFETYGDQRNLTAHTIIAVDNVSEFSRPRSSLNDPYSFRSKQEAIYKLGQYCFSSPDEISGQAGLLLIDKFGNVSLVVLAASTSQVKVKVSSVLLLNCIQVIQRDNETFQHDANRLEQQIEMQRKQNEMMIDLLKRQQQQLKRSQ